MYLARLFLDPRSRDVRRDLASPVELHRTVMRMFPDDVSSSGRAREALAVLHRLEEDPSGRPVLFVQGRAAPQPGKLPSGYLETRRSPSVRETSDWSALEPNLRLAFRLRANTTRKIDTKSRADGSRSNGQRVPTKSASPGWIGTRPPQVSRFDARTWR
ncbi:MAG: type I-E CRISPR-associated protein Cas6/Cse3/CasE [Deltaproteobacteria bacterium]|nr:type I-E CRISPR-associated protein Cas6/Cse3/CasE [Deltaproteobacteria bacterium]